METEKEPHIPMKVVAFSPPNPRSHTASLPLYFVSWSSQKPVQAQEERK